MIENLDGIYETVRFGENLKIRISYLDIPENFPPHWHIPVEILRCRENTYKIETHENVYMLDEGDIAIIRPGTIHGLFAPDEGKQTVYLADVTLFYNFAHLETLMSLLPPVMVVRRRDDETFYRQISEILWDIEKEYENTGGFYEAMIYSLLLKMFTFIGRHMNISGSVQWENTGMSKYGDRMMKVCEFINDNCTENITLEEAADIAGFSKYHFTRLFKEFTGTNFYRYLSRKRIANAEQMLSNPDYSVTEVAMQSGFASPGAFIRMFKQVKGCTPTEFREMYSHCNISK